MKMLLPTLFILLAGTALPAQNPISELKTQARSDYHVLSRSQADMPLQQAVDKDYPYLKHLYEYYHAHPELSFHEQQTAARMAQELRAIGFEVTERVGGTGVVGVLENGEGPVILVRADMDALPVTEETGLPYASTVVAQDDSGQQVGVMHACGHDVHMTVWAGAARQLVRLKDNWSGTIVFIGQPAEERGGGARDMLADGLYERFPLPDFALALHCSATLPAGSIGHRSEYALANVDMMDITIKGEGGHGAYPHTTKDPVMLASRIVVALQTIVSREISPLEPAVVTVGSIHGGTKGNIIPNEVKLELTMRSYTDEVRQAIIEKIERICRGVAISAGLTPEQYPVIQLREEFTPAAYNDPALSARMQQAFIQALGAEQVVEVAPVMAGEDFSRYGRTEEEVPCFIFWLGTVPPEDAAAAERGETTLPSLHNSKFAPLPEPSIKTGVVAMTTAVLNLLKRP